MSRIPLRSMRATAQISSNVNCFTNRISPSCEKHDSSMTATGGDHAAPVDPQSLDHRRKARPSRTPDAVPELGTRSADRQAGGTLDHRRDRGGGSPVSVGSLKNLLTTVRLPHAVARMSEATCGATPDIAPGTKCPGAHPGYARVAFGAAVNALRSP